MHAHTWKKGLLRPAIGAAWACALRTATTAPVLRRRPCMQDGDTRHFSTVDQPGHGGSEGTQVSQGSAPADTQFLANLALSLAPASVLSPQAMQAHSTSSGNRCRAQHTI